MKLLTAAFGLLVLACIAISSAIQAEVAATKDAKSLLACSRPHFKLPEMFNFERFKLIFKKSYSSLIENLVRKRIFLAKSFRVFVSVVFYKHKKTSSYLAINQMSDWTPEELERTHLSPEQLRESDDATDHENDEQFDREEVPVVEVANLGDIENEFKHILKQPSEVAGLSEIAEELLELGAEKSKNSGTDYLIRKPNPKSIDLGDTVASNNPNYQEPELTSFGSEELKPKLDEKKAAEIASQPSSNFFKDALQKVAALFKKPQQEIVKLEDGIHIDHRTTNCFFQPRDQGLCGSCYSFSTMALYEWHYCMSTGDKVAFSEQYIVDCGSRAGLNACNGGVTRYIHNFVDKYGLELRRNYPYRARNGTCPYPPNEPSKSMGYLRVKTRGFEVIFFKHAEDKLKESPLILSIHSSVNFYEYGGGVDDPKECKKSGHSVLIVGSGREDGLDYWLIRNSYGINWGDLGYYKLYKKSKCSFAYNYVFRLKNYNVPEGKSRDDASTQIKSLYNELIEDEIEKIAVRKRKEEFFRGNGF